MKTYTIDASSKALGRVASEAAHILAGKNTPAFRKNIVADVEVHVTNASKIKLDQKKREQTSFERYSGYPGGFRYQKMDEIIAKKGHKELIRQAVYGMLPINKLRSKRIKHLIVTE